MIQHSLYFVLIYVLTLFCSIPSVNAQKGSVAGIVYEGDGDIPLFGANVYIKNEYVGVSTKIDGTFLLENIPLGKQLLTISFLGFQTQEKEVFIKEDKIFRIEITLVSTSYKGEEIVVTAQALGQAKAIHRQINSESIANIVSAARIQELPDVNAAEAISRLPGISINRSGGEGQKVVIRGMAPKFAAITINGIRMPSNSGSDRSVDLSLISPELLDGIEIYKSPLPDMDAETIGGTVNMRLSKAPKKFRLLMKGLSGYNQLNKDFKDYKSVIQLSKRLFKSKIGFVLQGSVERFNRGGDFLTNTWRQGATDSLGTTAIYGKSLRLQDRIENRKRENASVALDYAVGKNKFSFFGLYSQTSRNRSLLEENYTPSEPAITFVGVNIENKLKLTSYSLQGEHTIGKSTIDWAIAKSKSRGDTPYNFAMKFENNTKVFDSNLNFDSHPREFYAAAKPNLEETYLRTANLNTSFNEELNSTFALNFKIPFHLGNKISGYFKTGGKYSTITRTRDKNKFSEDFYYLGGQIGRDAIAASSRELTLLPSNPELISVLSFINENNKLDFINEDNENVGLKVNLDPQLMRQWYSDQKELLSINRAVIVDRYEVDEKITAGYLMMKFNIGKSLSIIPGVRYEYSDNEYRSGVSTLSGRYGVNGTFTKTKTKKTYGEILPHLHLKYQVFDWLDIRASYATTLARPNFNYITPRSQVDNNSLVIKSGNPKLKHAKAQNYDLFLTAYMGNYGLFSFGTFYKKIDDIFYSWKTNLFDQETADAFGWSDYKGYELQTYVNSGISTIRGFEVDFQTNLRFLPKPFNGFVINVNYARLFSKTESFFLTSETKLIIPIPPVFETIYTNHVRIVPMPNQSPHVLNMSLGFDYKKFSSRISGSYQGTKADSYSSNKDFDKYTLSFWRWDASIKQRFGNKWSVFLNINNFTKQKDISFTRTSDYLNTIQRYGMTATLGLQYRIK